MVTSRRSAANQYKIKTIALIPNKEATIIRERLSVWEKAGLGKSPIGAKKATKNQMAAQAVGKT